MNNIPIIGEKRGFLIIAEGADASGKDMHVDLLRQALNKTGFSVKTFRSPGSTELGEKIREIFKSSNTPICPEAELLLMTASFAQLVKDAIKPALQEGNIVICNRFYWSTIIYQGFGKFVDKDIISANLHFVLNGLVPDLTLVLHTTDEETARRISERKTTDRFESESKEYHARIKQGFEWLMSLQEASKGAIIPIDSSGSIEDTHNEIFRCVAFKIGQLKEGTIEVDLAKKII
jgi:dTMP kinase